MKKSSQPPNPTEIASPHIPSGAANRCLGVSPSRPTRIRMRRGASPKYSPVRAIGKQTGDVDFLNRDEARGPRLELDYFKAELLLEQHGITHTVVVFGGTRIPEPLAARRKVERLRQAVENDPADPELRRQLTVAERIQVKSHYYEGRPFSSSSRHTHAEPRI